MHVRVCQNCLYLQSQVNFLLFLDWLELVFQQKNKEQIIQTVMLCWMLWKGRNEAVWKQHSIDINEVMHFAYSVLSQWISAQDKTFNSFLGFMSQEDGHEHWNLPTRAKIKINTDAALFEESSQYSYAYVIHDHNGDLLEAESKCFQRSICPEMVEAMGLRKVLSWVKRSKRKDVEIGLDCLQVVQFIRSSVTSLSYLGRVVEDGRMLLASLKDQNVLFRFIKRSANNVAHYLARYCCSVAVRR